MRDEGEGREEGREGGREGGRKGGREGGSGQSTGGERERGALSHTIFIHVYRVRSGRFGLRAGVNLTRPQLAWIIHHISLLMLGLGTEER